MPLRLACSSSFSDSQYYLSLKKVHVWFVDVLSVHMMIEHEMLVHLRPAIVFNCKHTMILVLGLAQAKQRKINSLIEN